MSVANETRRTFANRQDWLTTRREYIGASDSAAIFGLGYADQNAWTVWEDKVSRPLIEPGMASDEDERMIIGLLLEDRLRNIFTHKTGFDVIDSGPFTIRIHSDLPFMAATLDGKCVNPEFGEVPVELKNVDLRMAGEWSDGQTPLKFQIQAQHQMAVTDTPAVGMLGLIGGNRPEVRWVERNERFIAALMSHLESFWKYVEKREKPPVDHSYATAKVLARLHPNDNGKAVRLPQEAASWLRARSWGKAHIKACERVVREAENRLKACLGDNTYGELPDGSAAVSWKSQTKKEHIVSETTFRVLRTTKQLPKGVEHVDVPPQSAGSVVKAKRKSSYKAERKNLFAENPHCCHCGAELSIATATVEHIIPLSRGGSDRYENLALACEACNQQYGNLE